MPHENGLKYIKLWLEPLVSAFSVISKKYSFLNLLTISQLDID